MNKHDLRSVQLALELLLMKVISKFILRLQITISHKKGKKITPRQGKSILPYVFMAISVLSQMSLLYTTSPMEVLNPLKEPCRLMMVSKT